MYDGDYFTPEYDILERILYQNSSGHHFYQVDSSTCSMDDRFIFSLRGIRFILFLQACL